MLRALLAFGLLVVLTACPGPAAPSLGVAPDLLWIVQGGSGALTINASGLSGPVSVTGLPAGVSAAPVSLTGGSATVTLSAAPTAVQGPLDATVTVGGVSAAARLFVRGKPGSLDATFSGGGVRSWAAGPTYSSANDVQRGPDGAFLVAGLADSSASTTVQAFVARFTGSGALDTTFGAGGVTRIAVGAGAEQADALAVLPDGKLLLLGASFPGSGITPGYLFLARLNADGSPDTTFGAGGPTPGRVDLPQAYTLPGPLSYVDPLAGLTLAHDGRYVVVGHVRAAGFGDYAVAQAVLPSGAPQTPATLPLRASGGGTTPYAGALFAAVTDPVTGDILAAGVNNSKADMALARLSASLAPVTTGSWGSGVIEPPAGATLEAAAYGITLDAAGRILAVGASTNSGRLQLAVTRVTPEGNLDASFGTGGLFTLDPDNALGASVKVSGEGVLVGGFGTPGGAPAGHRSDLLLLRLTAGGALDAAFGDSGRVFTDVFANSRDAANAILVDPVMRVTVVGYSLQGPILSVALARYWN